MSLTELLSQTSALLSTVAYPAADAAIALSIIFLVARDKRALPLHLANPFSHVASAFLVILAASHCAGWVLTLNQVAAFALPLLAAHPSGHTLFQLANALGIYRLLRNTSSPLHCAASIVIHTYLVLANLDLSSKNLLASVMKDVSFAQLRELGALQKLRKLTLDDLWSLPERYHLRNAHSELTINTSEPLFLAWAIIRMIWKPMIPIHIAGMLFQLLPIIRTMLSGYIYQCLDSPDNNSYYMAYVAAAGVILIELLDAQKCHLANCREKETARVRNALKLELTCQPLIHSGLKSELSSWQASHAEQLVDKVMSLQQVIPSTFGILATIVPIYHQVGWYAFIPLLASLGVSTVEMALECFVGKTMDWDPTRDYVNGDTVRGMYLNVKTVKMFGWERMYLDPKLKKKREYMTRLPWYAPLVRFGFQVTDIVSTVTNSMSIYVTIALYLKDLSRAKVTMTNSQLLEMTEHIDTLRSNIIQVFGNISSISDITYYSYGIEPIFRCETFDTISHVSLDGPKSVPSIAMDNCSFRWNKYDPSILKKVSLNVTGGDLVAVVGKTGSGKSSLLLAMCKEMELTKGAGTVVGTVGYLEQAPWIMNDTMRANIIFGREFEEEYFWKVVHACALAQDMESWPDKDLTLIGERGVNISGGQRARLALARTVYSRADVYILDDPLSAVDAHVKRHILDNVILSTGLLGDKLRVVTTHTESMLPFCNQIVTVSDKIVSVIHQEPKEHTCIVPVATIEIAAISDPALDEVESDITPATSAADEIQATVASEDQQADDSESDEEQLLPKERTILDNARYVLKLCGWHIISAVVITASFRPLTKFILDGYNIAALKENAKANAVSHDAVLWYLKICLLKDITNGILYKFEIYVRNIVSGDRRESSIQAKFAHSLLHAPLSFVEKTSMYEVASAYDDGSCAMSRSIPSYLLSESSNIIGSVLTIWRSAMATPQLMLIVPFIAWARIKASVLTDTMADSLRQIRRSVSARHSQTASIIDDGSLMIRLFRVEPYYISRHISDKDEIMRISGPEKALSYLAALISTAICAAGKALSMFSVLVQSHSTKHKVSSGQLKMAQSDLADMINDIARLVKVPSQLKKYSNMVGTFRQYSDLAPEAPYIVDDCRVPSEWPHSGNVEFKSLSVKYGAKLDYALKNLNVTIRPGEKIGIVGRTGAGKSTLAKAIFRLLNKNVEGSIEIDGHDTAQFGVGDFRPKLGIIPQESAMFNGTVKRNLDPLHEFTIEDMWAVMIKCGVAELIDPERKHKPASEQAASMPTNASSESMDKEDDEVEDGEDEDEKTDRLRWENAGLLMRALLLVFNKKPQSYIDQTRCRIGINKQLRSNDRKFSNGQQQQFSLCRLLLRKRKVLILDEATADVDLETDRKMQELIRSEFSECTVLTIAHRLDTIMSSDRIIVMEKGEIVEIGPPQELIASGGKFAELVKANEF